MSNNRSIIFPSSCLANGFQFTHKTGVIFGPPPSMGAYGFTDLYTDQGIMQLQKFISHMRHQDEIGSSLINILLENLTLTLGTGKELFHQPPLEYLKYVEKTWITLVWEFLYLIKGQIHLENTWT